MTDSSEVQQSDASKRLKVSGVLIAQLCSTGTGTGSLRRRMHSCYLLYMLSWSAPECTKSQTLTFKL